MLQQAYVIINEYLFDLNEFRVVVFAKFNNTPIIIISARDAYKKLDA